MFKIRRDFASAVTFSALASFVASNIPAVTQVINPGVPVSGSPANNDCSKFVVSGGNVQSITTTGGPCTGAITPSAATQSNDTNVTLTLSGTPATALLQAVQFTMGWQGTLAAGRLNSNVVQGVTNDTNVTGSITAQNLTLGWQGVLAAARLNSNVVQAITNDTNIQGSITAQNLTLAWAGQLAISRGGTGAGTQSGAANNIFPTPTRAGDIVYWNGTQWTTLAGNNSGTGFLSENSLGAPSWAAGTGVTSITCGTGLSGGTITGTGTCALALTNIASTFAPGSPTGTTSAITVMMGQGTTCKFTPTYSSRVRITFTGTYGDTTLAAIVTLTRRFGTGTAPTNGAAATGTTVGTSLNMGEPVASTNIPYSTNDIITGLTPGTAYWFDQGLATSAGTASLASQTCTAEEIGG